MHIQISPGEGGPIYAQIVAQVKHLVASGRLGPGEELPPIRVLAERLLINPNTVARAYRELEVEGVVTKRRTAGTYVSEARAPLGLDDRLAILGPRADALLVEARRLEVGIEPLIGFLRDRDKASGTTRKEE